MAASGDLADVFRDSPGPGPQQDGLRIGYINAHSMGLSKYGKSKLAKIHKLITDHQLKVFAVSETWLSPQVSDDKLNIHNYKFIRSDRSNDGKGNKKKPAGGIVVYMHNDIFYQLKACEEVHTHIQYVIISIFKPTIIDLVVLYSPPEKENKKLLGQLLQFLSSSNHSNHPLVIIGDTNVDYCGAEFQSNSTMEQKVKRYTRVVRNKKGEMKGTLIDHIYISKLHLSRMIECDVVRCDVSDHDLIYCTITTPVVVEPDFVPAATPKPNRKFKPFPEPKPNPPSYPKRDTCLRPKTLRDNSLSKVRSSTQPQPGQQKMVPKTSEVSRCCVIS